MRKLLMIPGILVAFASSSALAEAQEADETIAVTGCLAQEADGEEVEYLLKDVTGELAAASEIEIIPGEGVALSDHVGHTVEVTGVLVADDAEDVVEAEAEVEEEAEVGAEVVVAEVEAEEDDVSIRATGLAHVEASCTEGEM